MSARTMAVFGVIVVIAVAGLDYGSEANGRTPDDPLSVADHVMTRFAQAKEAMGFGAAPDAEISTKTEALFGTAPPGPAEARIEAALAAADAKATNAPAPKDRPARKKPGQITVGVGACTKGGAGKFCSVGGG